MKLAGIIFAEKIRVEAQHRFDARFFVVSRDEEEQAWFGHAVSFKFQARSFKFSVGGGQVARATRRFALSCARFSATFCGSDCSI